MALWIAQRQSDVLRMNREMVKDGVMTLRQQKTGAIVRIPIAAELAEIIATSVTGIKFYLTSNLGKEYSSLALRAAFRKWCDAAGLPAEAHIYGLRKAWCRRAAEAGLAEEHIKSVSGHKTSREVQRYFQANRP